MPRATASPNAERFDLRTCPGGYVRLRTLSFHEQEVRKDIAGRMYQEQTAPQNRAQRRANKDMSQEELVRAYFEAMNVKVTEFEFHNCIVEHNLYVDDAETQLIDFSKPMRDWGLDPRIGQEISKLIDDLTSVEDEDDLDPLATPPSSFSQEEANLPKLSTVET